MMFPSFPGHLIIVQSEEPVSKAKRRKYTKEFKAEAMRLVREFLFRITSSILT